MDYFTLGLLGAYAMAAEAGGLAGAPKSSRYFWVPLLAGYLSAVSWKMHEQGVDIGFRGKQTVPHER